MPHESLSNVLAHVPLAGQLYNLRNVMCKDFPCLLTLFPYQDVTVCLVIDTRNADGA